MQKVSVPAQENSLGFSSCPRRFALASNLFHASDGELVLLLGCPPSFGSPLWQIREEDIPQYSQGQGYDAVYDEQPSPALVTMYAV